jgi:hypothetical protein
MSTITIKRGDTAQTIADTLLLNGAPLNLTGATVEAAWRLRTGTVVTKQAATLVSAVAGTVSYQFVTTDVAAAGEYLFEWQITLPTGRLTVPSTDYHTLLIVDDLHAPV